MAESVYQLTSKEPCFYFSCKSEVSSNMSNVSLTELLPVACFQVHQWWELLNQTLIS